MASVAVRRGIRVLGAYAVAVLVAYMLASVASTQWLLGSLVQAGSEVTATQRLVTTGQDLLGLLPSYGLTTAIGMAVGLPIAAKMAEFFPAVRGIGLVVAGGVALASVHIVAQQGQFVSPVAAAGTSGALPALGLAGGVGGYIYYLARRR